MRLEFSAGVLVYKYEDGEYRFLFLKREEGFLDLPKGHIEKGESAEQAAIRETKEESGLKVEIDPFYRYKVHYWFYDGSEKIKKENTIFIARVPDSAKVKVSYEHIGYVWLNYSAAMQLEKFKDTKELLKDAYEYIQKKDKIEKLNEEYRKLPMKYKKWDLSRRFVPGEGPANAEIAIVGQAPGDTEDKQGRPFVGRSGRLLDHLLNIAGIKRSRAYITSVVQFFPPRNRVPSKEEIMLCSGFLKKQLEIIKPRIVIILGNIAAYELLGIKKVTAAHGSMIRDKDVVYFVTLHPSAAVRIKSNLPIIESDFRKLKIIARDILREHSHNED